MSEIVKFTARTTRTRDTRNAQEKSRGLRAFFAGHERVQVVVINMYVLMLHNRTAFAGQIAYFVG